MSTVKVVNVQHPSASTAAVTLAADGSMTGAFPAPNRNLLYNGAMQVAQRGTSVTSITTGGYYTADRYFTNISSLGTWTQSVENDAPTGSGFRKSLKMLCTTADAAPAAGDFLTIYQYLEGQDLQRIAKGTASAQQMTLSFWVKSNVTGVYTLQLLDNDNSRQFSQSYSISASATWEKKTIVIPADITGAFDNDNAASLKIEFSLGLGSTFTSGSLATTWAAYANANIGPGQTNLAAAVNNYWQITGVQLEVGPVGTGFEFKSYGQELRECERYFQLAEGLAGVASTTSVFICHASLRTVMRAAPTTTAIFDTSVTISDDYVANFTSTGSIVSSAEMSAYGGRIHINGFTGLTQARFYGMYNSGAAISFSAEL